MEQRDDWHLTELVNTEPGRGDPFAAAVRATRMPMVITDPQRADNPIVFVNEAFQKLTGYEREEIVGRNCRFLQGPDTDRDDIAKIRHAIEQGEPVEVDILNYRKDGSTFWNALYLSPVRGDDDTLLFFFASQMNVTERIEARDAIARQKAKVDREVGRRTAELEAALEAKTLLLHEVDHRVKNNLTMIGSLLRLQARSIQDPVLSGKLTAMLERLDALATVHRRLYQGDDIARFDVSGFLLTLVTDLFAASGREDVEVRTRLSPILIGSAQASTLGLVLNEIVTNAIKHAFADGRSGVFEATAHANGRQARIEIADNGPGFDPASPPGSGLGHTLITRLARQADASVEFARGDPGMRIILTFPVAAEA